MRAKASDEAGIKRAEEHAARHMCLAEEATADAETWRMLRAILESHGRDPMCACEGCMELLRVSMACFVQGLRVGVEMEKADIPEPV
jgi:alkanesulfonate monooxygenase SsuD/methylene tetrahydromethanopterin reductase-like flavin-dependent oxidoreductase (luciferase family)